MNYYFSRTGTGRNLDACKAAEFGILVSRAGEWRREGFDDYVGDCGAWADFQAKRDFDEEAFERFLIWIATQRVAPKFVLLPDKVAAGQESLDMSMRWMNRTRSCSNLVLIPVQDGMTEADLAPLVGPHVGIFLGGSTEWKLATMRPWGDFCHARDVYYHVGRVNTLIRFGMAAGARADSADGSSASKYAETIPLLKAGRDRARKYYAALERAA